MNNMTPEQALIKELRFWRSERPDEWKMDEIIRLAEKALSAPRVPDGWMLLQAAKCPDCDDVGWYMFAGHAGEPEQCQCVFCYAVPNSRFNLNNILASIKEQPND